MEEKASAFVVEDTALAVASAGKRVHKEKDLSSSPSLSLSYGPSRDQRKA
ncbi:unnamed protein product [marine sediment metagenome]|uniref:Uncharacterized protein n=1 Tax=marine sediment metagenome TaxID=412755 RepID=X1R7Z9_9ZZZZ